MFIEQQHALELWRARRGTPEIRSIVQEGMTRGAALKESGAGREAVYDRLMALGDMLPATSSPVVDE